MKILQVSFLIAILSLGYWLLGIPQAISMPTKAETTYDNCQKVAQYYLAEIKQTIPQISDPNSVSQPIVAEGEGFFWNQPDDMVFIPSDRINPSPIAGVAKTGSYLSPQKVTCDLNTGKIVIEMKAFLLLEDAKEPLVINQVDEMQWDGSDEVFKGQVLFAIENHKPYFQIDSDFVFRDCNAKGTNCNSIDILLFFPLPKELPCVSFAQATYGLDLKYPSEIETCGLYTENLNYFWDNPEQVVVFERDGNPILGSHLQVVNNVWLEVTYRDRRVFEYRGASCYLQYTSNAKQDWNNPDFNTDLCSPRKIVQIK